MSGAKPSREWLYVDDIAGSRVVIDGVGIAAPYRLTPGSGPCAQQIADNRLIAAAPLLLKALAGAVLRLESVQWQGYVTESGERACPCCEAWFYQGEGVEPKHAYACGLAADIEAARAALAAARGGGR